MARAVPVKAKLGKCLPDFCGGLLAKGNPNPFADDFGQAKRVRALLAKQGQDFNGGQFAELLALLAVNRQAFVGVRCGWRYSARCCAAGVFP